jgi:hypothetical protein
VVSGWVTRTTHHPIVMHCPKHSIVAAAAAAPAASVFIFGFSSPSSLVITVDLFIQVIAQNVIVIIAAPPSLAPLRHVSGYQGRQLLISDLSILSARRHTLSPKHKSHDQVM